MVYTKFMAVVSANDLV